MKKRKKLSLDTQKVWNTILIEFANRLRRFQKNLPPLDDNCIAMAQMLEIDISTLEKDLGLEATIETIEKLIDKGILRLVTDEKISGVWLEVYDPFTNSYLKC